MTVRELKRELSAKLNELENPQLEVRVLLSHFLSLSHSELITRDLEEVPEEKAERIMEAAAERRSGRPSAYITGHREFYGYDFHVSEDVLIPQPDTETLVEEAIRIIDRHNIHSVLDICTGSGAIISALKAERKDIAAFFSDLSSPALEIARENYERITGERAQCRLSDLFDAWSSFSFDMITANAPYVTLKCYEDVSMEVKMEPRLALLDYDDDGLGIIRRIIKNAPAYLSHEGFLLLEADFRQHGTIRKELEINGYGNIRTINDLGGRERVTIAQKA